MNGGQQRHAAVGGRRHGVQILPDGNLVHGDDLRVGGPQQYGDPRRLRAAVQHVRMAAHRQLGHTPVHSGDLSPLIHYRHPLGGTAL